MSGVHAPLPGFALVGRAEHPAGEFSARGRAWRAGVEDRFLLVRPGRKARQPAWRQARVLLRKRRPAVIRAEHAVGRADEVARLSFGLVRSAAILKTRPVTVSICFHSLAAVVRHVQPRIAAHEAAARPGRGRGRSAARGSFSSHGCDAADGRPRHAAVARHFDGPAVGPVDDVGIGGVVFGRRRRAATTKVLHVNEVPCLPAVVAVEGVGHVGLHEHRPGVQGRDAPAVQRRARAKPNVHERRLRLGGNRSRHGKQRGGNRQQQLLHLNNPHSMKPLPGQTSSIVVRDNPVDQIAGAPPLPVHGWSARSAPRHHASSSGSPLNETAASSSSSVTKNGPTWSASRPSSSRSRRCTSTDAVRRAFHPLADIRIMMRSIPKVAASGVSAEYAINREWLVSVPDSPAAAC